MPEQVWWEVLGLGPVECGQPLKWVDGGPGAGQGVWPGSLLSGRSPLVPCHQCRRLCHQEYI